MSYWTRIVGVMHVETYHETDNIKEYVEKLLENAPKITGSEGDASVFVNPEAGYSIWTSFDCGRCKYGDSIVYYKDGFLCDAHESYRCPTGEYQSRVVITVQGDLRDRMKAQTKKEWNAFHRYVAKELGFGIRIATCKIDGY